jgi:uncharacterized protein (TIGR03083 family)
MTTPLYSELVAFVRSEGEGILAAGRLGLDVPVETCGQWKMSDLLLHVGRVYTRAGTLVGERQTTQMDYPAAPPRGTDPVEFLDEALDRLVHALGDADPDTPAWNWSSEPDVAAFWARRMAHESAVHHYDAQRAHSLAQPMDADLAHDGMDELIDLIMPRIRERDGRELPEATYCFVATDEGSWPVRLGADGVERLDVAKEPDVTVRGTASALLLAAYNRVKWTSLEVEGDMAALEAWSRSLQF